MIKPSHLLNIRLPLLQNYLLTKPQASQEKETYYILQPTSSIFHSPPPSRAISISLNQPPNPKTANMQFLSQLLLTLTLALAASLAVAAPLTPGGPEPQSADIDAPDAALKSRQQDGQACGGLSFLCQHPEYPFCCKLFPGALVIACCPDSASCPTGLISFPKGCIPH
ncbi:hypothetical protein DFH27DRAFT_607560 [Peziza echinospora]|nr:hypothetical protein DFH27DRAFT_607560 [Peziza echinospora]